MRAYPDSLFKIVAWLSLPHPLSAALLLCIVYLLCLLLPNILTMFAVCLPYENAKFHEGSEHCPPNDAYQMPHTVLGTE